MTTHIETILTHIDEQTGREIRRFPVLGNRASMIYFRQPKRLLDNRMMISVKPLDGRRVLALLDPETGAADIIEMPVYPLRLRERDGLLWYFDPEGGLWQRQLSAGDPVLIWQTTPELPGTVIDITCDGRYLITYCFEDDIHGRAPTTQNAPALFEFFNRPRRGALYSYDLQTGAIATMVELDGMLPIHPDASPADPLLVKFSHDKFDAHCQRIWTVRVDGSGLTKIRPQEWNEFITHEFWWPDGQYIGYKYQDRRHDPTVMDLPWGEYSPIPTQVGLADLTGKQVYLSDPLESYHSHIFVSADGKRLSGEGTHDHSFVYAAEFDRATTKINFQPLATIHTPYLPMAGQTVNAGFTADGKWLLYNDTIQGEWQVCAVRAD